MPSTSSSLQFLYWRSPFIIFLIFNIVSVNSFSQPLKDTLYITSANGDYTVYQHLYLYKTNDDDLPLKNFNTVKARGFSKLSPQKSFSERLTVAKKYWLLFTAKNKTSKSGVFYFQLNSQVLDVVEGYEKNEGPDFSYIGSSGTNIPFDGRAYHYYDVVYPIRIDPGKTVTLLFSINNDDGNDIHFLPQLRSENIFKAEEEKFYTVTGLITGLMLTVFLLNIFLWISLKEKLHFLYGFYILAALYEIFSMKGTDIQYIYPNHPLMSGYLQNFAPCLLAVLMTYIMQWFLDQKKADSKIKIFVDIGLYLIIAMVPISILIATIFSTNRFLNGLDEILLAVILLVQCLLFVASAIEKVLQGYKPAWFYLAAVSVFLIGLAEFIWMVLTGANQQQVLKRYPNDIEIGIVVETMIVFFGIVYRYNLYKKEKEQLLTDLNLQQQNLIKEIVGAEEAERKRIAEDLHDDVGATLSALSMYLSNLGQTFTNETDIEKYKAYGLKLSNKAVEDIRAIAHNLLPKDFMGTGLFNTLENRITELNTTGPIRFTLVAEGEEAKINEILAITAYRIVNELLTNICKHSLAADAAIQVLIEEKSLQIMAEDDGVGFNSNQVGHGIGLKNIKGRVEFLKGDIHVDSNHQGTQTIIQIPF